MYRVVDFGQEKLGIKGKIIAFEYDPIRSAYLALVEYEDNTKRYVLAAHNLNIGDEIICAADAPLKTGNRAMLKNIPVGTEVFNIELENGKGGKIVRSAGGTATIMAIEDNFVQLKMPSKEIRKIYATCYATIGQVSHPEYRFENFGKAGSRRRKGWRPAVRGSAMNPPDHPHGGGEGRTGIGLRKPKLLGENLLWGLKLVILVNGQIN